MRSTSRLRKTNCRPTCLGTFPRSAPRCREFHPRRRHRNPARRATSRPGKPRASANRPRRKSPACSHACCPYLPAKTAPGNKRRTRRARKAPSRPAASRSVATRTDSAAATRTAVVVAADVDRPRANPAITASRQGPAVTANATRNRKKMNNVRQTVDVGGAAAGAAASPRKLAPGKAAHRKLAATQSPKRQLPITTSRQRPRTSHAGALPTSVAPTSRVAVAAASARRTRRLPPPPQWTNRPGRTNSLR